MKKCNYVIDTSYLDEYYQIDKYSKKANIPEIKKRFDKAFNNSSRLFVPVPVIFEIANHIAHVRGDRRYELAERFTNDIQNSHEKHSPFHIEQCKEFETVQCLVEKLTQYSKEYVLQGLGLTDTAVYLQAERLSEDNKKYKKIKYIPVHIWTKDNSLKSREPDPEEDPFLGEGVQKH